LFEDELPGHVVLYRPAEGIAGELLLCSGQLRPIKLSECDMDFVR
jgi:hypothetical protein